MEVREDPAGEEAREGRAEEEVESAIVLLAVVMLATSSSGLTLALASTFCTATEGAGATLVVLELRLKMPSHPPCRVVLPLAVDEEEEEGGAFVRRAIRAGVLDFGARPESLLVVWAEETVRMDAEIELERMREG